MAGETIITVIGNLTADPELRFTPSGAAVANFTVASTPRHFDKQSQAWVDDDALFMRCAIWRDAAEHVAESLTRGMRVIAVGRLQQRSYETREGEKRTVYEMQVDEVGPSMKFATAKVQRIARAGQQAGYADDPWASTPPPEDPWSSSTPAADGTPATTPATQGAFTDEPPF